MEFIELKELQRETMGKILKRLRKKVGTQYELDLKKLEKVAAVMQRDPSMAHHFGRLLFDNDDRIRLNAARALRVAADRSIDVSSAVPDFIDCLHVHYENVDLMNEITRAWTRVPAKKWIDVRLAVNTVGSAITYTQGFSGSYEYRRNLAGLLVAAARNRADIGSTALKLEEERSIRLAFLDISEHLALALALHYMNKKEWQKLSDLLLKPSLLDVDKFFNGLTDSFIYDNYEVPLEIIPSLIRLLDSRNVQVRCYAAKILGIALKDHDLPEAIAALENVIVPDTDLHDTTHFLHEAVAVLLRKYLEKDEWDKVEALYLHKNGSVRICLVAQFEKICEHEEIQDEKVINLLINALRNGVPIERASAASALGHIKDERVILPLIKAFEDSEKDVREKAVHAIINIGAAAVQHLVRELNDEGNQNSRHLQTSIFGALLDIIEKSDNLIDLIALQVEIKQAIENLDRDSSMYKETRKLLIMKLQDINEKKNSLIGRQLDIEVDKSKIKPPKDRGSETFRVRRMAA